MLSKGSETSKFFSKGAIVETASRSLLSRSRAGIAIAAVCAVAAISALGTGDETKAGITSPDHLQPAVVQAADTGKGGGTPAASETAAAESAPALHAPAATASDPRYDEATQAVIDAMKANEPPEPAPAEQSVTDGQIEQMTKDAEEALSLQVDDDGNYIIQDYVVSAETLHAIHYASENLDVDFGLMMAIAAKESRLGDPNWLEARNSSATGLFQFTNVGWYRALYAFGEKHGLDDYVKHIKKLEGKDGSTTWAIYDKDMRRKILDMRNDQKLSAVMAAEMVLDNAHRFEKMVGREPKPTEMYLTHLLGIGKAVSMVKLLGSSPDASADAKLGKAARNNPGVFKDRTVAQAYDHLKDFIRGNRENFMPLKDGVTSVAMGITEPYDSDKGCFAESGVASVTVKKDGTRISKDADGKVHCTGGPAVVNEKRGISVAYENGEKRDVPLPTVKPEVPQRKI